MFVLVFFGVSVTVSIPFMSIMFVAAFVTIVVVILGRIIVVRLYSMLLLLFVHYY